MVNKRYVTSIAITPDGGPTSLAAGQTLQLSANVLPETAQNKTINWSIVSRAGASINTTTGLFNAGTARGEVVVRAQALDGSYVDSRKSIYVDAQAEIPNNLRLVSYLNSWAKVSWQPPNNTAGFPVLYYEATADGTTWTKTASTSSHTFVGLSTVQTYTLQVRAVTKAGAGQAATLNYSRSVAPDVPQNLSTAAADQQVTLSWDAPASNGGSAITKYVVKKDNGSWIDADSASSHTFTGLTIGQSYTFYVRAINIAGAGSEASLQASAKPSQAAPAAPVRVSKTATGITVQPPNGIDAGDVEYRLGDVGAWVTSGVFSSLSPNTEYKIYMRLKETQTHAASPASVALIVTTDKATLTGTVSITGTAVYGQTLTANTSGLSSTPNVAPGTLTYRWLRNGTAIPNAAGSSYVLGQDDITHTIRVEVTAQNCTGSKTSAAALVVGKAAGPAVPTTFTGSYTGDGTNFTYTISPIPGAEYSNDNTSW
ncbi:MAG: fibronectin type III domain-containing protein [Christensenellales bacterium]|jgi:hypothetical protein